MLSSPERGDICPQISPYPVAHMYLAAQDSLITLSRAASVVKLF